MLAGRLSFLNVVKRSDLLLVVMWIVAIIVVNPVGEFPLNDDWAYAKNVYHLAVKHQFVVDQFPAMNLVSQTVYGSLFVWCCGFSFFILRFSVFLLVITSSLTLKKLIGLITGGNEWLSFVVTGFLFFNPLLFFLSFTYMTDMFFISMIIFSLWNFYAFLKQERPVNFVLFVLFIALAVLNRQHALLISFLSLAFVRLNRKHWIKALLILIPPVVAWLAHDKYRHYLAEYHVANGIRYTGDLLAYLSKSSFSDHIMKAADSMIVAGSVLAPVALLLLFLNPKFSVKSFLVMVLAAIVFGCILSFDRMTYPLGNIAGILETGPKVVKTDHQEGRSAAVEILRIIKMCVAYVSLLLIAAHLVRNKPAIRMPNILVPVLFTSLILIFVLFVAINEAYFDRYAIPFILFLTLLLIPADTKVPSGKVKSLFTVLLVFLFGVSVVETRDHFNWQRTRWKALKDLNDSGISAKRIDGGFEYNGWYKPIEGWPEAGKSWWWVADDEYVVSTQRLKGYEIDTAYSYRRLLPYTTDTVFVLKRNKEEGK